MLACLVSYRYEKVHVILSACLSTITFSLDLSPSISSMYLPPFISSSIFLFPVIYLCSCRILSMFMPAPHVYLTCHLLSLFDFYCGTVCLSICLMLYLCNRECLLLSRPVYLSLPTRKLLSQAVHFLLVVCMHTLAHALSRTVKLFCYPHNGV